MVRTGLGIAGCRPQSEQAVLWLAAAGSEYKVDASYLSPNVNITSRLEAATKQFGVSMLMSKVRCLMAVRRSNGE